MLRLCIYELLLLLLSRLLRAMGWTEADDDNNAYEITADDVREFEDLCRQMKLNKASRAVCCYNWHNWKLTAEHRFVICRLRPAKR